VKGCHASSIGASARREYISDRDILDQFGVKIGLCVSCTKDMREEKIWFGVLETAFSALRNS